MVLHQCWLQLPAIVPGLALPSWASFENTAVVAIKGLRRVAEISHWGANLNIPDEIHVYNAGSK